MLMGQAKILAADPGLEGCLVAPRGEDHIGGIRICRAEHLQAHKARLLIDLTRPGSKPLLELLTPWRCDRNTIGNNVHASLLRHLAAPPAARLPRAPRSAADGTSP